MIGTPRVCRSSAGSLAVLPPPSHDWLATPLTSSPRPPLIIPGRLRRLTAPGTPPSGRVEDLAAPVGAAGRTGYVRQLGLVALRAAHQRGRGGLPVRASRAGIAAGHPPLGNSHVSPPVCRWRRPDGRFALVVVVLAASARPTWDRVRPRARAPGPPPPAARRTGRKARGSRPCTAATSAGPAPPRRGRPAPGRAGRRRGSAPR